MLCIKSGAKSHKLTIVSFTEQKNDDDDGNDDVSMALPHLEQDNDE